MKTALHILKLLLVAVILITSPTSRHFCEEMMTDSTCEMHKGCCEHNNDDAHDCCIDEYHLYTNDFQEAPSFQNSVIAHLSDFWSVNLIYGVDINFDLFLTSSRYLSQSYLPPKNETERYKYVQSYLI